MYHKQYQCSALGTAICYEIETESDILSLCDLSSESLYSPLIAAQLLWSIENEDESAIAAHSVGSVRFYVRVYSKVG